ncbi:MAG: hypothetical protein ACRDNL_23740, partial [Spirillospora sp.]
MPGRSTVTRAGDAGRASRSWPPANRRSPVRTSTPDHADAPRPPLRTGRWRLPGGHATGRKARRSIRRALRRWGLGSAADDLADQFATLVQDVLARSPMRGRC